MLYCETHNNMKTLTNCLPLFIIKILNVKTNKLELFSGMRLSYTMYITAEFTTFKQKEQYRFIRLLKIKLEEQYSSDNADSPHKIPVLFFTFSILS
jgi:hypothetical protein